MPPAVTVNLKVIPNAPRSEVVGWRGGELTVKVAAAPRDGRANAELRDLLAEVFGVASSDVTILRGDTSRHKRVQILGIDAARARSRLQKHQG